MKKTIVIFVILSTIASAINYFAYPVLGRILPSSQYIDITVALSLFTQITTFLSSINAIAIGLTKSDNEDPKSILDQLQSALFKIFALLIIVFAITSPFILGSIGVPISFSLPIALMMLASLPLTIMSGYLNGKQLMIKLGILTVISAGFQFTFGVTVAALSNDGFTTMISMALAQFCAIFFIYRIFLNEKLPSPIPKFKQTGTVMKSLLSKKIIIYAAIASVSIMLVNLVQIADLLLITQHGNGDDKFYTDLYIVSRIMFFAGMIFIWPFLGELNVKRLSENHRPLYKLLFIFTLLLIAIILPLMVFGSQILHILLGVWYSTNSIAFIGSLSVLFKFFLLISTAITLYFMVIRSYIAVIYSVILCAAIALYSFIAPTTLSTLQTIQQLTIIAGIGAVIGILLFMVNTRTHK
jgi:O-antigen/teichoic acid export membrane protein